MSEAIDKPNPNKTDSLNPKGGHTGNPQHPATPPKAPAPKK